MFRGPPAPRRGAAAMAGPRGALAGARSPHAAAAGPAPSRPPHPAAEPDPPARHWTAASPRAAQPPRARRPRGLRASPALLPLLLAAALLLLVAHTARAAPAAAKPLAEQMPAKGDSRASPAPASPHSPPGFAPACPRCPSGLCAPGTTECLPVDDGGRCSAAADCRSGICGADGACLPRTSPAPAAASSPAQRQPKSFGTHLLEAVEVLLFTFLSLGLLVNILLHTVGVLIFVANFLVPTSLPPLPTLSLSGFKGRLAAGLAAMGRLASRDRQREAGYDC
ncbi:hypothetical protein DFJ74DRAFT_113129 [Hyaloraphidium curvatum]|nr:hypothetical protein DFJ74DRAFT_113129 [Hyaloraphidium curvatum]